MTVDLVIKIDEEYLKDIKKCVNNGDIDYEPWVAIAKGIIIPKGHGDLIDRRELKTHFIGTEQGTDLEVYLESTIIDAQAIIEADKEVDDGC